VDSWLPDRQVNVLQCFETSVKITVLQVEISHMIWTLCNTTVRTLSFASQNFTQLHCIFTFTKGPLGKFGNWQNLLLY